MDENLEFHIKVCKVSSLLGDVVLVCARTEQLKHVFSSLTGLLLWNLHGQNPWPAWWWVLLSFPWGCCNNILICQTVTCTHTAPVGGNTFTNLNFLFFQWQRPTCRSTRTRTGCRLSRFVVYLVYFFGVWYYSVFLTPRLVFSPPGMHWAFCLQPRRGYGCDRWGQI